MQNLPAAEVYADEIKYMPWGYLINELAAYCIASIPQNGSVVDLCCGTGSLLVMLQEKRPDISYVGVDLESEYTAYASKANPNIRFVTADVLEWESAEEYDTVLCTAGLHHLPFEKQEAFVKKISSLVKIGGFAIIADPYVDSFSNETERKIAGAKLGYEYLAETIRNKATDEVIEAAIEVLRNDVFGIEYKNSISVARPVFEKYFSTVDMHKTWPKETTEYGDYYFILKR